MEPRVLRGADVEFDVINEVQYQDYSVSLLCYFHTTIYYDFCNIHVNAYFLHVEYGVFKCTGLSCSGILDYSTLLMVGKWLIRPPSVLTMILYYKHELF